VDLALVGRTTVSIQGEGRKEGRKERRKEEEEERRKEGRRNKG